MQEKERPEEMPAPERQPEAPGIYAPDAPIMPPDSPGIPIEQPEHEKPPMEIPGPGKPNP